MLSSLASRPVRRSEILFEPVRIGELELANRVAMAPMTRAMSPGGVPTQDVARYYERRAQGGVGLIITEGTFIPHKSAGHDQNAPRFHGKDALAGWKRVVERVHDAGGRIFPQLWHVGLVRKPKVVGASDVFDPGVDAFSQISPSGIIGGNNLRLERVGEPATIEEIEEVLEAYAIAAQSARELGFDGIEIHGAHGYLIDQFLWRATNLRDDEYGGDIPRRSHFASEVVRRIRQAVGTDFPIVMRLSTWKQQDYTAKLVESPEDWQAVVQPMAEAGVDAFHVSQRRYWEGEFGTNLNLAGWTKKLTGKPTITVGSVSLGNSMAEMMLGHGSAPIDNLEPLLDGFERGDFDVVAVGRAMIANPDWPQRIRSGAPLTSYSLKMLQSLD
jgi:2,4-dienoyl-CoA reductase-like NADH-dependent reductase (Old Yellow Enzyme family)